MFTLNILLSRVCVCEREKEKRKRDRQTDIKQERKRKLQIILYGYLESSDKTVLPNIWKTDRILLNLRPEAGNHGT